MSETDDAAAPIVEPVTEKQVVIYRDGDGFGFHLPVQHSVRLNDRVVDLSIPDRGGIYHLRRVEETDEEYRIHICRESEGGHALAGLDPVYPFPTIDEELLRLKGLWVRAGLGQAAFDAWVPGADFDSHTTGIRRALREAGAFDSGTGV